MPDVQEKIRRVGRVVGTLCTVARVLLSVSSVAFFVIAVLMYCNVPVPTGFVEKATDNGIFQYLVMIPNVERTVPARELLMIRSFTYAISQLILLYLVSIVHSMVADVAEGEEPFQVKTARRLRRSLWQVLFLALMNVMVALVVFFFGLLVSYLIEYGAYLQQRANEVSRIQEQIIVQFAEITENKSGQTGQHVKRVSEYARVLADEMGLSSTEADNIRLASTMHDVGKLLIPSEILDKPGRLTDEEYAVIKQHTTYGGQLLNNVEGEVMRLSRTIALDHHERWDGHGYAQGKVGEDISLEGRIVAVADVYDALTSRRSYKDAWDDREAYDEIVRCSGTQFDPAVVEAFERRYDEINEIRRRYHDDA